MYSISHTNSNSYRSNTFGLVDRHQSTKQESSFFYELEPATVVDIILDDKHPYFNNKLLDKNEFPEKYDGSPHKNDDVDYSWIGRAKIRMFYSNQGVTTDELVWAIPLENNIKEYPLINETVIVAKYFDKYYYSRKLNFKNTINSNADFRFEKRSSLSNIAAGAEKKSDNISKVAIGEGENYTGYLGNYFKFNKKIRPLLSFEGDTILESRFGSSIRFSGYQNNKDIDVGIGDYKDGMGNPSILIRNRQKPITDDKEKLINANISEDVNLDGSSIQLTSGKTISGYNVTTKMIPSYELLKKQELIGNQVVINTDRIILSTKNNEFLSYSKKRYAVVTDDEYTVDANKQMIMFTNESFSLFAKKPITTNTNVKTVINSPFVFLGQEPQVEPVILGNVALGLLNELFDWLGVHTHHYQHSHPNAGEANPPRTQETVQLQKLKEIQSRLSTMLSNRVFLVKNIKPEKYVKDRS